MCKNKQCCHKALCQLESTWGMNKSLLCSSRFCLWKIPFCRDILICSNFIQVYASMTSLVSMKLLLIYPKNEMWTRRSNLGWHVQTELFSLKFIFRHQKRKTNSLPNTQYPAILSISHGSPQLEMLMCSMSLKVPHSKLIQINMQRIEVFRNIAHHKSMCLYIHVLRLSPLYEKKSIREVYYFRLHLPRRPAF